MPDSFTSQARWSALVCCFDDGRLGPDNNPAERALRCVRKNYYLFAGSDSGAAASNVIGRRRRNNGVAGPAWQELLPEMPDHRITLKRRDRWRGKS